MILEQRTWRAQWLAARLVARGATWIEAICAASLCVHAYPDPLARRARGEIPAPIGGEAVRRHLQRRGVLP